MEEFLEFPGRQSVSHHHQRGYLKDLHAKLLCKYWMTGCVRGECKNKILFKERAMISYSQCFLLAHSLV